MTVTMKDNPKQAAGESKRRKIVDTFWIDYGRCMRSPASRYATSTPSP